MFRLAPGIMHGKVLADSVNTVLTSPYSVETFSRQENSKHIFHFTKNLINVHLKVVLEEKSVRVFFSVNHKKLNAN